MKRVPLQLGLCRLPADQVLTVELAEPLRHFLTALVAVWRVAPDLLSLAEEKVVCLDHPVVTFGPDGRPAFVGRREKQGVSQEPEVNGMAVGEEGHCRVL